MILLYMVEPLAGQVVVRLVYLPRTEYKESKPRNRHLHQKQNDQTETVGSHKHKAVAIGSRMGLYYPDLIRYPEW